jgi:hypothetical protein
MLSICRYKFSIKRGRTTELRELVPKNIKKEIINEFFSILVIGFRKPRGEKEQIMVFIALRSQDG